MPRRPSTFNVARVRLRQAFADLDRRGLAGAVRPEQAEAFARMDVEIETVDGHDVVKCFAQVLNAEGCGRRHTPIILIAMTEPAYPAARAVAARVQRHFTEHLAAARRRGRTDLAPEPDPTDIEAMIDAAFWASLRREEGVTPTISLALLPPEGAGQAITFAHDLPLRASALAKLAPAVERPGIHLGVWRSMNGGTAICASGARPARFRRSVLVVEVVASGLHRRQAPQRSVRQVRERRRARGRRDQDRRRGLLDAAAECPAPVKSLLGFETPGRAVRSGRRAGAAGGVDARASSRRRAPGGAGGHRGLARVDRHARALQPSSRRSRAGGPGRAGEAQSPSSHEWQEDLAARDRRDRRTDGRRRRHDHHRSRSSSWRSAPRSRAAAATAVSSASSSPSPSRAARRRSWPPTQLGGTRHLSAAQFVHDQRDAIALVASQDGRFTIFKWSPREDMVHAHRVEALLI